MLRAFETNDNYEHPPSPYGCNKVLVTSDQLNNSYSSSSTGSSHLFVKPLRTESSNRSNSKSFDLDSTGRHLKIEDDATSLAPNRLPSYESMISKTPHGKIRTRIDGNSHRMASPSKPHHINRSSFSRNSNLRRSLGGASIFDLLQDDQDDRSSPKDGFSLKSDSNTGFPISNRMPNSPNHNYPTPSTSSKPQSELHLGSTIQSFRVVDLPSLEDMGLNLEPYHDPDSGTLLGVRIWDKFHDINYQPSNRSRCPFRSGDVIVGVNRHHLPGMYESSALRCVRDAFREARTYTVEFGVIRVPQNLDSPSRRSKTTAPSTLPRRLSRPDITSFDWDKPHNQPTESPSAHQPRRRTEAPVFNPESHLASRSNYIPGTTNNSVSGSVSDTNNTIEDYVKSNRFSQWDKRSSTTTNQNHTHYHNPYPMSPDQLAGYSQNQSIRCSEIPTELPKSPIYPDSFRRSGFRNSSTSGVNSPGEAKNKSAGPTIRELNAFNTRTIGQKIVIELTKFEVGGLGFTLTSRDTQTANSGSDPVYVKKILPTGAAIVDGRLMVGDRLLAVDGVDTRTLDQVLSQLRSIPPGQVVRLVISRQVSSSTEGSSKSARQELPPRYFLEHTYTYHVPPNATGDNEPPCLGVNFKWHNDIPLSACSNDSSEKFAPVPGLFVEGFLPGGLISNGTNSANTLRIGDHLVAVNNEILIGLQWKEIVLKLKHVLLECQRIDSTGSFTLTVRRYHKRPHRDSIRTPTSPSPSIPKISVDSISEPDHRSKELNRRESLTHSNESISDSCGKWVTLVDSRRRSLSRQGSINELSPNNNRKSNLNRYSVIGDLFVHNSIMDIDNEEQFSTSGTTHQYRNLSVPPRQSYFTREGFGRRSVSEKRHGHLEASQFSFYQTNILPNRYRMPEDVDKQYSTMPTTRRLKMHKARMAAAAASGASGMTGLSSTGPGPLKALHPSEIFPDQPLLTKQSSEPSRRDSPPKANSTLTNTDHFLVRNRKQNSSFRHAVDRSFNTDSASQQLANRDSSSTEIIDIWSNYANINSYTNLPTSCPKPEKPPSSFPRPFSLLDSNSNTIDNNNNNNNSNCVAPSPPPRTHSRSRVHDLKQRSNVNVRSNAKNENPDNLNILYQSLSNSYNDTSTNYSHHHLQRDRPQFKHQIPDPDLGTPHSSRSNSTQNSLRDSVGKNKLSAIKGLFRRSNSKPLQENLSPDKLTLQDSKIRNPKLNRRLSVPDYRLITAQTNTSYPHSHLNPTSSSKVTTDQINVDSSNSSSSRTHHLTQTNSCDSDTSRGHQTITPVKSHSNSSHSTRLSSNGHLKTINNVSISPPAHSNNTRSPAIPPRIRRSETSGSVSAFPRKNTIVTANVNGTTDVPPRLHRKSHPRPLPDVPSQQSQLNYRSTRSSTHSTSRQPIEVVKSSNKHKESVSMLCPHYSEHFYPTITTEPSVGSSRKVHQAELVIDKSIRSPPSSRSSHKLVSSGYQINSVRQHSSSSHNRSQTKPSNSNRNPELVSATRNVTSHNQSQSSRFVSSDFQTPDHYPTLPNRTYRHNIAVSPPHHVSRSVSQTRRQVAPQSLSRELNAESAKAKQLVIPVARR